MSKSKRNEENTLADLLEGISPEEQEKTDKKMLLAAKIANAIENKKDVTKSGLAKRLNKYPSEINKWLSGTHNFTIDTLMDLEKELDLRLLDFDEEKAKGSQKKVERKATKNSSKPAKYSRIR